GKLLQYELVGLSKSPATQPAVEILVLDLSRTKLLPNRHYKLAPMVHVLTSTVKLPSGCTLDATGATIEFTGKDWAPAIILNGANNATLIGGTWTLGRMNFVCDASNVTSFTMRDVHLIDGGGLVQGRGVSDVTIENCVADIVERNFIYFGDSLNENVTIRNVTLVGGSRAESGIRIHRTKNLLIDGCDINAPISKKSALRLHDGWDFLVKNTHFSGNTGAGPLAKGDGGRRWGIDQFIRFDGKETTDPHEADFMRTMARRREKLALRADGVRFENVTIDGSLVLKAGVIGFDMRGGSITPKGNARAFEQTTLVYPETPQWQLPGDLLRPAPTGQLVGVTIRQNSADLNAPIAIADCDIAKKEIPETP
ncbi:MAG TPA: right-handed parallel beta-helix repeat-containing protein, partial [Tepidisphaeraceae bacterium]|nr:right-handed parallel beta-helix repeat-containing protein [Tepidisphaeraceae bacterium]